MKALGGSLTTKNDFVISTATINSVAGITTHTFRGDDADVHGSEYYSHSEYVNLTAHPSVGCRGKKVTEKARDSETIKTVVAI